jgi:hypothetical protein
MPAMPWNSDDITEEVEYVPERLILEGIVRLRHPFCMCLGCAEERHEA